MVEMSQDYAFKRQGLIVSQPFGEFFVVAIPARVLLDVAYSDRLTADRQPNGSYKLGGSQRPVAERRLKEIGQFIDSPTASFPNTIILAANYRFDDGLIEEEDDSKWKLTTDKNGLTGTLLIPTNAKLAPIIDGQHRLFGFNYAEAKGALEMPLLCAIFFDLPKPYQAFLFATINANQRPVSKSLTYELFGYNVEEESPEKWTPEKLAVFLTRKLGTEKESPFANHITIAAENDFAPKMAEVKREQGWAVSTATVVEGIVRLISQNPKRDAFKMGGRLTYEGKERSALSDTFSDSSPLRTLYTSKGDDLIYTGVNNFFAAVSKILWRDADAESLIRKTVGIQALFDLARIIMGEMVSKKDFRVAKFEEILKPAKRIDFTDTFFQSSGTGRQRIRNCLELCTGYKNLAAITSDRDAYKRICQL
jgi:DNA phosphorothioation-associated DGQHR protein 1